MDVKAAQGGKAQGSRYKAQERHKGQGTRRLLHLASGIRHPASFVPQRFDRI